MGCGCAAGNGPLMTAGGAWEAWRSRGPFGDLRQSPYETEVPAAPAGQVFFSSPYLYGSMYSSPYPYLPYSYPYPNELLSDCARWRGLTQNQKYQQASQTVPPWRVPMVVADLDRACIAPYSVSLYPYAYVLPWAFPRFYTVWSSGGYHHGGGGHHHPGGEPIQPAG